MFNIFLFNCCQDVAQGEAEFDLDIRNSITNSSSLEEEIKKLKLSLKDKLCLFTIYSHSKDLFPLNELKNDEEAENILNQKYFEIYRRQNNILSLSLIKKFNLQNNSLVTMILFIDETQNGNNESNNINDLKLIDCLKEKEVTRHNIKKLLKIYQYINYKPPLEPDINDPNCCNITFRFVDEKLSFSRRYSKKTNIEELYFIIKSKYPDMAFKLFRISPSSELKELKNNLEQENLYPSGIIQVVS